MIYSRYCIHECEVGKKKAEEVLQEYDSVSDAAIDMQEFVCTRCKDCSHKED